MNQNVCVRTNTKDINSPAGISDGQGTGLPRTTTEFYLDHRTCATCAACSEVYSWSGHIGGLAKRNGGDSNRPDVHTLSRPDSAGLGQKYQEVGCRSRVAICTDDNVFCSGAVELANTNHEIGNCEWPGH